MAPEGRDEKDLTVEYVTGKMDEYQRRTEARVDSEIALKSAVRGKQYNRNKKCNTAEPEKDDKSRKETRTCFHCHKPGHLKAKCFWYKKTQD